MLRFDGPRVLRASLGLDRMRFVYIKTTASKRFLSSFSGTEFVISFVRCAN